MTNYVKGLDVLFPGVVLKYRDASNYKRLVETWGEGDPTIPSDADLIAAYEEGRFVRTLIRVKNEINVAMRDRIEQGVRWAWSAEEAEYNIFLTPAMRELLAGWHQLLNQSIPAENPHLGFIKSGDVIIWGPGGIDIPDAAVAEIAEFSGLWVSKISQMAIAETISLNSMTQAQLDAYDAYAVNWTIRTETIGGIGLQDWDVSRTDWDDDLVLYHPN